MELGLHLRLTEDQAARVLASIRDDDALSRVLEDLEENEAVFARACQTDKAWDPISCALAPAGDEAAWPARGVIGGARSLQDDSDESWVTHLYPAEVSEVAAYLGSLTDADFRRSYAGMPEELRNPEYGAEEEEYALGWLAGLREFFAEAASARDHVVFSVGF